MSSNWTEICSEASLQHLKPIETRITQKQIIAVESKDNLLISAEPKIQKKMNTILNLQEHKVESVNTLRVKLEETQARASTKNK